MKLIKHLMLVESEMSKHSNVPVACSNAGVSVCFEFCTFFTVKSYLVLEKLIIK